MLIEIQEKKMHIEIFGENHIDSNLIKNQIILSPVSVQIQKKDNLNGVENDLNSVD